jgi:glycerol-3-phosphate dehydrogenase
VARIEHLLRRYGSLTGELLDMVAADPTLGRPLAGADDYLRVEAVYAVTHEGARHLDDVLARRTHISIETWDRGLTAAEEVAALMAGAMKWRHRQVTRELENYRTSVAAERKSQEADTDTDADAIRLGAPDIVPVVMRDGTPDGAGSAGQAATEPASHRSGGQSRRGNGLAGRSRTAAPDN